MALLSLCGVAAVALADEAPPEAQGSDPSEGVTVITEPAPRRPVPSVSWDTLILLGEEVAPGERRRLFLRASESFAGDAVDVPLLVMRGPTPGPTLCLTAGIHGDELNGIEIVRQFFETTRTKELSGTLIGVPVVNLHGFRRSSRYLPDRRDLNRYFPGHPAGSSASRIANALFEGVVRRCDALVDFHSGSFHRANLPQLRADLRSKAILDLARGFGGGVVVHNEGAPGTLRRAAVDEGIPTVTYEAGEPMRFQTEEIRRGVDGISNLATSMGLVQRKPRKLGPQRVYFRSRWVRVNHGGIFINQRELGETVKAGDVLGTITDPVSNERGRIVSPFTGKIIGMAVSQVVIPGFAAFHVGIDDGVADLEEPVFLHPAALPSVDAGPFLHPEQLDPEEQPE
jgi:uncharacterized protein